MGIVGDELIASAIVQLANAINKYAEQLKREQDRKDKLIREYEVTGHGLDSVGTQERAAHSS
jgi:hypothetical protein